MTDKPDQSLGNDSVDLAYFFVPLVEPLALPDGACQRFGERFSYEDWTAAIEAGQEVPFDSVKRLVSLMIRQTTVQDFSLLGVGPAFRVALDAFPTLTNSVHEPRPTTLPRTVIEAAVELLPYDGKSPSQDVISEALDTALRCIRQFQRAYRFVTNRPVTLTTRERMPPFLPMALRLGINPDEPPSWPDDIELFPVNENFQEVVVQEADEELLKRLSEASETIQEGRAFSRYPDFVREATVALRQHGDYKTAVVLGATAAEIFLDDLLMHLLWEERRRPEEVAPIFEQGLAARVRKHFSSRLGGQWSFDHSGPVQAWHRDLAGLRHRVVHAGHEPSKPEAEAALTALSDLEAFLLHRMTQKPQLVNYARTAVILLGKLGLAQRGKLSDKIERLMDDPNEPPWGDTFRRWRDVVAHCRADPADRIEPQAARAVSVAMISPNGAIGWWLHDRETNLVCSAKTPSLPENQQAALDRMVEAVEARGSQPISAAIADADIQPVEPVVWAFAYRVLPTAGVMVDRSDLASTPTLTT